MSRSRNFCFTDHILYPTEDYELVKKVRYIIVSEEIGKKTNKKHYQGWVQFEAPISFKQAIKRLPTGIHIELCKGSEYDNDKYCKKDNKIIYQHGEFITQGSRCDLETIYKDINNGLSDLQLADKYPKQWTRYYKAFTKYKEMKLKENSKDFRHINCEYIHGETGTGKTREAVENNPDAFLINGFDINWWDGYSGEKTLIIDEYDNDIKITKLLKILDGYQLRLPIKGGFTYANWNKIIITSNLNESELHANAKPEHRKALFRRINKITRSVGNTNTTLP